MELLCTLTNINTLDQLKDLVDGVIVGDDYFANRVNHHFTRNEITEINDKCHELNIKLFILINRMIEEDDLAMLDDYLTFIAGLNVEGIYFNDLSVLVIGRKHGLTNKLSFNPDTLMTNYMDVKMYLDEGINSVVISKELTLQEILEISNYNPNSCDFIIHGRLNMSYTKRHFIKNYMAYLNKEYPGDDNLHLELIESTRSGRMPVLENAQGTSIFTDYTLAGFNEVTALIDSKIKRLIIDDIFIETNELLDVCLGYRHIINGQNSVEIFEELKEKYASSNYQTGYMYQKTNLVK